MGDYKIIRKKAKPGFVLFPSLSMTIWFILINVVLFFAFFVLLGQGVPLNAVGLEPGLLIKGKNIWTLLTHFFMHGGFAHLFVNMFSLFFIGSLVEKIIGKKRYFWFYIISGLFAGLFFALLAGFFGSSELGARIFGAPDDVGVGASGALFGLLGILAVILPFGKVYLIAGPLVAIIIQAILDQFISGSIMNVLNFLVTAYFFVAIFSIISFNRRIMKIALPVEMHFWLLPVIAIVPLVIIGLFVKLPIGNMAHFGGLLAGLVYGLYLRNKYKRKVKILRRYFS